jgi:hypothetical protein
MLKIERTGEDRLDMEMRGKLDADAMKKVLDEFVEKSDGIENGKVM